MKVEYLGKYTSQLIIHRRSADVEKIVDAQVHTDIDSSFFQQERTYPASPPGFSDAANGSLSERSTCRNDVAVHHMKICT